MNYKHEWIANNVIITYFGVISKDDIIKSISTSLNDTRFDTAKFQIADFTEVEEMHLDGSFLDILSSLEQMSERKCAQVKIANVSNNSNITDKVMSHKGHVLGIAKESKLFTNLKDALRWGYEKNEA